MKTVVLITGASSGIGKCAAEYLIKKGFVVYGAARSTDKMEGLVQLGGNAIYMDVTSGESTAEGINSILKKEGRIDCLINNAGYGLYGSVEEVSIEDAKKQMDVNLFGLARLTQLVLPIMREQKSGRIINISSIAGKITSPMGAWYFASKHAVEGFSDSLRQEVKPFGIDVVIIEPGGVKSEWSSIGRSYLMERSQGGPYEDLATKIAGYFPFVDEENSDPVIIAELIYKAITAKRPKTRYIGGARALELLIAKKLLSDRLFDDAVLSQIKQRRKE
ncbi:SDR family NAD(P)-dependent oxidoreductase [Bacteroidales bacterium OttesenSCG-928-M11]|nr:SDR family NAD(P)-dependent oxidoreductase [Bacteroidales bacterium OttesenSCG-928-M11]